MTVDIIPDENKAPILKSLKSLKRIFHNKNQITGLIQQLSKPLDIVKYKQFIKFSAILDKRRGQNLLDVAPHMINNLGRSLYYE